MREVQGDALTELKALIQTIEDYSGMLGWDLRNFIFSDMKYLKPNLDIAQHVNRQTSAGRLPSAKVPGAMLQMGMDNGLYPVRIDKSRLMFIHHEEMLDLKDRILEAYNRQQNEKSKNPDTKESSNDGKELPPSENKAGLIGI